MKVAGIDNFLMSFNPKEQDMFIARIGARRYVRPMWLIYYSGFEMGDRITMPGNFNFYRYPEYYRHQLRQMNNNIPMSLSDLLSVFYPGYGWGYRFSGDFDDSRLLMSLDGLTLSFYTESMLDRDLGMTVQVRIPRSDFSYGPPEKLSEVPLYLPAVRDRYRQPLPMIILYGSTPVGAVNVGVDHTYSEGFKKSINSRTAMDMTPYFNNLASIEAMIRTR